MLILTTYHLAHLMFELSYRIYASIRSISLLIMYESPSLCLIDKSLTLLQSMNADLKIIDYADIAMFKPGR